MDAKIKSQEKEQGKKIKHNADRVWGWSSPAGVFRVERRIKEISRYINHDRKQRVLEIGCGTGVFTRHFFMNGVRPIAVDISGDLLKKAKERNPDIVFIQADAEKLPFKDGSFDCVLGISILHHLNTSEALKDMRRVLVGGGTIIFSEPNMANPQIFLQKRIPWLKKVLCDTQTETAFFRWRLKSVLKKNGFTDISIYPFEFLHPQTPRTLINFLRCLELRLEHVPILREVAGSLLIFSRISNLESR